MVAILLHPIVIGLPHGGCVAAHMTADIMPYDRPTTAADSRALLSRFIQLCVPDLFSAIRQHIQHDSGSPGAYGWCTPRCHCPQLFCLLLMRTCTIP